MECWITQTLKKKDKNKLFLKAKLLKAILDRLQSCFCKAKLKTR